MLRVVYIDVLFFINFIINYLILFASGKLTGSIIRRFLIALAATVGALHSCVVYFLDMEFMWALTVKVAIASVMLIISFGVKKDFLRVFFSFCGVSFAFGGCVLAIFFATDGAGGIINMKNGVFYLKISLSVLLVSAGICYFLLNLVFARCTAKGKGRGICKINIRHLDKEISFQAIVDSGNHLTDPLSNRRVVIVEYNCVRELFTKDVICILDTASAGDFPLCIDKLPDVYRFRLLPYKTLGCELDMLLAFKPDSVFVDGKNEKGMLVAMCKTRISDGGVYSAIVSDAT